MGLRRTARRTDLFPPKAKDSGRWPSGAAGLPGERRHGRGLSSASSTARPTDKALDKPRQLRTRHDVHLRAGAVSWERTMTLRGPARTRQRRAPAGLRPNSSSIRQGAVVHRARLCRSRSGWQRRMGWTGYFGAPRLATAAMGAAEFQRSSQNVIKVALEILRRSRLPIDPPLRRARWDPLDAAGEQDQLDHERTVEKKQADWLRAHKLAIARRLQRSDDDDHGRDPGPARPVAVTAGPGRVRLRARALS